MKFFVKKIQPNFYKLLSKLAHQLEKFTNTIYRTIKKELQRLIFVGIKRLIIFKLLQKINRHNKRKNPNYFESINNVLTF